MDTIILLKLLGIYMIVSGLAMLFRGKTLVLVAKDLLGHRALMWLAGFFLIIVGGSLALEPLGFFWVSVLGWDWGLELGLELEVDWNWWLELKFGVNWDWGLELGLRLELEVDWDWRLELK